MKRAYSVEQSVILCSCLACFGTCLLLSLSARLHIIKISSLYTNIKPNYIQKLISCSAVNTLLFSCLRFCESEAFKQTAWNLMSFNCWNIQLRIYISCPTYSQQFLHSTEIVKYWSVAPASLQYLQTVTWTSDLLHSFNPIARYYLNTRQCFPVTRSVPLSGLIPHNNGHSVMMTGHTKHITKNTVTHTNSL